MAPGRGSTGPGKPGVAGVRAVSEALDLRRFPGGSYLGDFHVGSRTTRGSVSVFRGSFAGAGGIFISGEG